MSSTSMIQEILGPASSKKVSLSPPWIATLDQQEATKFEIDLIQEYRRPQTTLKAMRLSVAHAAYYNQKLVFTLGERTLESIVRGDPNWLHYGGMIPRFTKGHLGQYYKELEGMGITGLTRSRPHSKIAPIFIISEASPLRKLINADFEKQIREAWEFATPTAQDVLIPELVTKLGLIPKAALKNSKQEGMKKKQMNSHSLVQSELQEREKEKEERERETKSRSVDRSGKSLFLRLGIAPDWRNS